MNQRAKEDSERGLPTAFRNLSYLQKALRQPEGNSIIDTSIPWFFRGLAKQSKITRSQICFQVSRVQNWKISIMQVCKFQDPQPNRHSQGQQVTAIPSFYAEGVNVRERQLPSQPMFDCFPGSPGSGHCTSIPVHILCPLELLDTHMASQHKH